MILLNIKTTDKLENQMSTLAKLKSGNFLYKNQEMLKEKVWTE